MTLSCIIAPPDRFVLNLTVTWFYNIGATMRVDTINSDASLEPLVKESDGNFSRNIMLNPVKTSDARRYFCHYAVGSVNNNESADLIVQSK